MANLEGRRLPAPSPPGEELTSLFGGVRRDLSWAKTAQSGDKLKYVADLPLSLVGDLVTLPKVVIGTHSDPLLRESDSNATTGAFNTAGKSVGTP
jgi:hypothetical protein